MATTTNYGWATPDDTDLVKDGAAAIRTLGTSIDTSFAADEGDLLVGGTSDIFEALPIGAAGTVLTSDGDTAEWVAPAAGDFTLITRNSFSNVASVNFDSVFTSTYKTYYVVIENLFAATAVNNPQIQFRYGSTTLTADYYGAAFYRVYDSTSNFSVNTNNGSELTLSNGSGDDADNGYSGVLVFNNVGTSSTYARFHGTGWNSYNWGVILSGGWTRTANTYTGFRLKSSSSNITGTVAVYGLGI